MAYPGENYMASGMTHRVHINPNFRGRTVCPSVSGERPMGIHVNPHWKPKTDTRDAANESEVAPKPLSNLPDLSHPGCGQKRTIHINPKVIASMGPESVSKLVEQDNERNRAISVASAGYAVAVKPLPSHHKADMVTIQELSLNEKNAISMKPLIMEGKENLGSGHLYKYKKYQQNANSPAVRIARTVRSKYKYLNIASASHSLMYSQYTLRKFNNEKPMGTQGNQFKYMKSNTKRSNTGSSSVTSGTPKTQHIISRFKLVKNAATAGTGVKSAEVSHILTPRRSKAMKILENVKNIHVHRLKNQYSASKGMVSRPQSTYKHNGHSNVPKMKSNSRFKFVRQPPLVQRTPPKRKSPRAVTSRFKIVRGTTSQICETPRTTRYRVVRNFGSPNTFRQKTQQQQLTRSALRNRWMNFRADLRATSVVVTSKKLLRIGQRPTKRHSSMDSAKKAKLLNIGGVFYRSTRTTLTRSAGADSSKDAGNKRPYQEKGQILSIRGSKFVLDKTGKTLNRLSPNMKNSPNISRIHIGGVTFVRSSDDTLVRSRVHEARNLVSQAKQKSIAVLTSQLRKNNQPCLIYQRLGKCRLHEKGICRRVHDPKMIAVCSDFVSGKCLKTADECSLSHNIGPEKMPTCHFFLEGFCVRDPCPYVHVKLNKKAAVCREFLAGYCDAGDKCKKRHVFLCPEFEERKTCSKGKYCKYRHAGVQKSKGDRANNPKGDIRAESRTGEDSSQSTNPPEEKANPLVRYYVRGDGASTRVDKGSRLSGRKDKSKSKKDCSPDKNEEDNDEKEAANVLRPERSKLGDLPGYIPL